MYSTNTDMYSVGLVHSALNHSVFYSGVLLQFNFIKALGVFWVDPRGSSRVSSLGGFSPQ